MPRDVDDGAAGAERGGRRARARGASHLPRIISLKHGENEETRLCWAARMGKLSRVRELCDWRAGIEVANMDGRTLYDACWKGYFHVVRELLAGGANVNAVCNNGYTPLIKASWNGHVEVVRALAAGADKRHLSYGSRHTAAVAGFTAIQGSRAAILALLAAAP